MTVNEAVIRTHMMTNLQNDYFTFFFLKWVGSEGTSASEKRDIFLKTTITSTNTAAAIFLVAPYLP